MALTSAEARKEQDEAGLQAESEEEGSDPLRCPLCGKKFSQRAALEAHGRVHSGERPYTCDICSRTFTQRSNLVRHKRLIHSNVGQRCDSCGEVFTSRRQLAKHRAKIHILDRPVAPHRSKGAAVRRLHECSLCAKRFTWPRTLEAHAKTVHAGERTLKCFLCPKHFGDKGTLLKHERIHRLEGRPSHVCSTCGRGFSSRGALGEHLRIHSDEKPYICETCLREFRHVSNWLRHRRLVHHERTQQCGVCEQCFETRRSLNEHQLREHGPGLTTTIAQQQPDEEKDAPAHACDYCNATFKNWDDLNRHRVVHVGEKRHQCKVCLDTYATEQQLSAHLRSHGDKVVCPECPKWFASEASLERHRSRSHQEEGGGDHRCGKCDKGFVTRSQLEFHSASHGSEKPFVCHLCGREFLRKRSLVAHRGYVHQVEPKFCCELCGKAFPWQASLEAHSRTHTDTRPFQCGTCDARFRTKHHLQRHASVHDRQKKTPSKDARVDEQLNPSLVVPRTSSSLGKSLCPEEKSFSRRKALNVVFLSKDKD